MECNRDEAIRARTIAERKLVEKDFTGSKKFALKAQALYPGLEGIPQMLTTLDVYISAENKVNGELDWYGILGVSPSDDDEIVKKQYRKLALVLHPDKNKSTGADGAFKLISEAWGLLSDKGKRSAYNQRRNSKGFQHQKVNLSEPSAAPPPRSNGFHSFARANSNLNLKTNKSTSKASHSSVPPPSHKRTDTFWTICHRCKMHYEYLKVYLNHTLLCPNCQEAFQASETAPPVNFSKPINPSASTAANHMSTGRSPSAGSTGFNPSNSKNIQQGTTFSRTEPSVAAKAAYVVKQANERMKREREESSSGYNPVFTGDGLTKKRRGLDEDGQTGFPNGDMKKGGFEMDRNNRFYGFPNPQIKPNSTRDLTPLETRNMLMQKALIEIRKKLKEQSADTVIKAEPKAEKESKNEKEKTTVKGRTQNLNSNNGSSSTTKRAEQANTPADNPAEVKPQMVSMNVPDPDFHDFDLDRTERAFGDNQVWAAYDDDDGMPRFYALIHKVISRKPFKMKISWLNSKTNTEFGPVEWVSRGFFKTCGEFRVGRHEIYKTLNSFSHKVEWTKGPRGTVHIFPKKGEIWALYRNWSSDWNEHTPDEVIHKYDMVQVLDDYNEQQGVSVTPLVKVPGFRTVFYPRLDPNKAIKIPNQEMFRLSHRVPSYLLTGQEAQNAPKGCHELDTAATPLELLQVTTEAKDVAMTKNNEHGEAETRSKEEVMVANGEETKQEDTI